ncbi:sulfite exporter TauE/SafE family protein [Pelagibius marinus]|uniref:sulfite exporter TauE/SafE family protein n=1 Tax=Pelagibius marinus TaxID=2762760 RepID=UPI0018727B96|nr:sulfite exporter TauE/SafE family protein [Pelagibius marinus]
MGQALWSWLLEGHFLWLAGAAVLAGLVRGFSGFGAAMIFVPLAGMLEAPTVAVPLLFLVDSFATLPITLRAFRRCTWAEILPLMLGATLTIPLGVALLVAADPLVMRWVISLSILAAVLALAAGWRLQRRLPFLGTAAVGAVAGVTGGAASLSGPPLVLFWLGGQAGAAQVRDNIYAIFGLLGVVAGLTLWLNGLLTLAVLRQALVLLPVYVLAIAVGAKLFPHASEGFYRKVALGLCGLAALGALPLWERLA